MPESALKFTETDEAGNVTATYVQTKTSESRVARIDRIKPNEPKTFLKQLLDVFLPAGYPHSVTDDYLSYQIYDSLQAFSSSIAGLLASRAVLEGVGVGDASASATSALLLSILQESMGRIATILFAHRLGTSLEPECKMYRLLADIFNDAAMVLDCLSPAFPKPFRVMLLASSSVLRSLCGVAAGSAKASLSAHFARWGNLGELNAKDSSQETVISLLGMLVGCFIVKITNTSLATWTTLLLLLMLHLGTNYLAVRSVCMRTLNRQRANIVFAWLHKHNQLLTPKQVSAKERIFEIDGVLRDADDKCLGYGKIGISMSMLLERLGSTDKLTGFTSLSADQLLHLLGVFQDEDYVLHMDRSSGMACILFKRNSDTMVQLKAWYHALLVAQQISRTGKQSGDKDPMAAMQSTLVAVRQDWETVKAKLSEAGWDLKTAALETTPGTRVCIES